MRDDNTAKTLKKLIRLWAVLSDKNPVTVTTELKKQMNIHTFIGNEQAQKLAIEYLRKKLDGSD